MLADVTTTMLQNVYNFLFVLIRGSFYRLKEPILKSHWGVTEGFFDSNFPKPERIWMKRRI